MLARLEAGGKRVVEYRVPCAYTIIYVLFLEEEENFTQKINAAYLGNLHGNLAPAELNLKLREGIRK